MPDINLDSILSDLGNFGNFQKRNYVLICFVVIFSVFPMSYIFVSRDVQYRCRIPVCDDDGPYVHESNSDWIRNAVPFHHETPKRCKRYEFAVAENVTEIIVVENATFCTDPLAFDKNRETSCTDFVFETTDRTLLHDFDNMMCEENLWKVTLPGTISCMGEFFCLPVSGFVSDRYGRRTMLLAAMLLSTVAGIIRSLSPNYVMYIVMEFLDTFLGSGSFSAAFILGMELVSPKHRVLGTTVISCFYSLGVAWLGTVAWMTKSWRLMLRVLYAPGFLFVLYYWLLPESVRWLMSKGRKQAAIKVLEKVAKMNGKELSLGATEKLAAVESVGGTADEPIAKRRESMFHVFRSMPLVLRLLNCSFCWICCNFVYYGLTLHAVNIAGNFYLNFIGSALIEIPAYLATYVMLNRFGRRLTLTPLLCLSGVACLVFIFVPSTHPQLRVCVYLVGKFCATISYTVLYMYTTEMFPTCLRHSLLATCSMFGRIGSMLAPQVPLLALIDRNLPLILFGSLAITSALLALAFPETLDTKLPDTIEEAVHIRSNRKSKKTAQNHHVTSAP